MPLNVCHWYFSNIPMAWLSDSNHPAIHLENSAAQMATLTACSQDSVRPYDAVVSVVHHWIVFDTFDIRPMIFAMMHCQHQHRQRLFAVAPTTYHWSIWLSCSLRRSHGKRFTWKRMRETKRREKKENENISRWNAMWMRDEIRHIWVNWQNAFSQTLRFMHDGKNETSTDFSNFTRNRIQRLRCPSLFYALRFLCYGGRRRRRCSSFFSVLHSAERAISIAWCNFNFIVG